MGTLRRRVPALGLVVALLCALTLVVPAAASANPATHLGHVAKTVAVTAFGKQGPSLRIDQPVATQPHARQPVDDETVAAGAAAPADPLARTPTALHTRGPPAGR